jgi:hypothetical protein
MANITPARYILTPNQIGTEPARELLNQAATNYASLRRMLEGVDVTDLPAPLATAVDAFKNYQETLGELPGKMTNQAIETPTRIADTLYKKSQEIMSYA